MKGRVVKNKPQSIACQLCKSTFSLYAFASHLKYVHAMSSDAYESRFEIFRKQKPPKKRSVNQVVCGICHSRFSSVGMFTHLRDSHNLSIESYVKQHGEFRQRFLKSVARTQICTMCGTTGLSPKGLSVHIKRDHNLDVASYMIRSYFNNKPPQCKCGCGTILSIDTLTVSNISEYVSGHNSKGNTNPRFGASITDATRIKMKSAARIRMIKQLEQSGHPPHHSPAARKKSGATQTDKFVTRVQKENNITILATTRRSSNTGYYSVQCNACSLIFDAWHGRLVCPICNPSPKSKLEEKLYKDLVVLTQVKIVRNSRSILSNGLELDFYFPEYNLAVEIHGLYYHGELHGKTAAYHLQKMNLCAAQGIRLIQVFEDEFVTKYDVVLEKILRLLNQSKSIKIDARKCDVREITSTEMREFIDKYHLQGSNNASIRLGLYHGDMLVSVMTFAKPSASKGKVQQRNRAYELVRFCVHNEYNVRGSAGKLLTYFKKTYVPSYILSFADLRWVDKQQNVYESLGFEYSHQSNPNYWYFKGMKRYHRFNFTKKKTVQLGGDPLKTEWENMVAMGYDRIWDCGNLKYEMIENLGASYF